MTSLVRCLNVQKEKILVTQGGQTIFGLAEIIRIEKTGRSGHQDHLKPGQDANTADQINRGNDRTAQPKAFGNRRHGGTAALPPQPDRRGRLMPLGLALGINGMLDADLLGAFHQRAQLLATISLGPVLLYGLAGDIVRWRSGHLFLAAVPDQQVPIAHTRIKGKLIATQLVLKRPNQLGRIGAGDVVSRKVKHGFGSVGCTAQGYQIAPKRNIFRPQVHPHTGRLDG